MIMVVVMIMVFMRLWFRIVAPVAAVLVMIMLIMIVVVFLMIVEMVLVRHVEVSLSLTECSVMMSHVMGVTMSPAVTVAMTSSLHPAHQREAEHDGQGPSQPGHPVLGELVPGEHLEEGDVEEGAGGQALEDADQQHVAPRLVSVALVDGHDDADEDADGGVEAEDDDVDDELHLLDAAGEHVRADAEHDGDGVDG